MMRNVTVIPARSRAEVRKETRRIRKIRVAAYCRVSTDQEEQLNSFENQVEYYTKYINENPEYQLVGIYADEGISGTNTKKRKEFNRMIADCEKGLIDLVITKSISRFARNTQDCLQYSRKLKNLGIGIYFEKENISTLDATGELLFTILSSLAQDESRNISENCKWGIRSKFQKGIPHINTYKFMGYNKNEEGRLEIDEEQAEIVRRIYRQFLEGSSTSQIAKELNDEGVSGVSGKPQWCKVTIEGMLKNEKYKGDALLQKTYTADFLTKKQVKNNGEIEQYYVKDSHPAIISKDEWEAVQLEFARREEFMKEHNLKRYGYGYATSPFCSKIFCGKCGSAYGRKSWSNRNIHYWQCNKRTKEKGIAGCRSENIKEELMKKAFVKAWNEIVLEREKLLESWKKQQSEGNELEKIRAEQMEELTECGPIREYCEEFTRMVIEKVIVISADKFEFYFLDGTVKRIEV